MGWRDGAAAARAGLTMARLPLTYAIEALGHHDLPPNLSTASDGDVEAVLRRAAMFIGRLASEIEVARVASVMPGSCIACTDFVAYVEGVPMLVARPQLF